MQVTVNINGRVFSLPQQIIEKSGTIKDLIDEYPNEESIPIEWNVDLGVDFNVVLDLLISGGTTDNILIYITDMMFSDHLNLQTELSVDIEPKDQQQGWIRWMGGYLGWKHYPLLNEFTIMRQNNIVSKYLVSLLQKLDMSKYGPSFLKAYYPDLSEDDAFRQLGFENALHFYKTNCYRTIHFKEPGNLTTTQKRIDVLTSGTKEWIVLSGRLVFYLDSNGRLKCLNESFSLDGVYRKLFTAGSYLVLERNDGVTVMTDLDSTYEELQYDMNLDYAKQIGDHTIIIAFSKKGMNFFYSNHARVSNLYKSRVRPTSYNLLPGDEINWNTDNTYLVMKIRDLGIQEEDDNGHTYRNEQKYLVPFVYDEEREQSLRFPCNFSLRSTVAAKYNEEYIEGEKIVQISPISGYSCPFILELNMLTESGKLFHYNDRNKTLTRVHHNRIVTRIMFSDVATVVITI